MSNTIKIPLSRPLLGEEEERAIKRVLDSGWLTSGKEVLALEKEFADFLSTPQLEALAVQSCTAALHLAYKSLGVDTGSKVISSTINFVSSVSTALYCGAEIEFVDCAPNSLYPSIVELERVQKDKYKKVLNILPLSGYHPHYSDFFDFASHNGFQTLEDAAHALPAYAYCGSAVQPYGTIADVGVYSFYANKTITSGEGGMLVSREKDIIERARPFRSLGMNKITWERFQNKPEQYAYDIVELGYKYNMPDILAAIARSQLEKAQIFHAMRTKIAKHYLERLSTKDYWILPEYDDKLLSHSWHLFVLRIDHPTITRDEFMHKLAALGVGTSVHYTPLHLMTYFKARYNFNSTDFPNAFATSKKILSIPIFSGMSIDEADYVCDSLIRIGEGRV